MFNGRPCTNLSEQFEVFVAHGEEAENGQAAQGDDELRLARAKPHIVRFVAKIFRCPVCESKPRPKPAHQLSYLGVMNQAKRSVWTSFSFKV